MTSQYSAFLRAAYRRLSLSASGRSLVLYILSLTILGLFQAPRLAAVFDDLATDFPGAGYTAHIIRSMGELSGATAAGKAVSAWQESLTPHTILGSLGNERSKAPQAPLPAPNKIHEQVHEGQRSASSQPASLDAPPASTAVTTASTGLPTALSASALDTQAALPATAAHHAESSKNMTANAHNSNLETRSKLHASRSIPDEMLGDNTLSPTPATQNTKPHITSPHSSKGTAPTSDGDPPSITVETCIPENLSTAGEQTEDKTAPNEESPAPVVQPEDTQDSNEEYNKPLVLLAGDSLMMEGLGPALLRSLRDRDDLDVVRDARYSTGLSRKDYFDWPAYMETLVDTHDPAIVVITLGGNDAQDIVDDNKKRHFVGSESWETLYRERVTSLITAAQGKGATVIWVGLPIMGGPKHAAFSLQLSEQQKAACTNSTSQIYVDTLAALADDQGNFTAFIKDSDGKQKRIRYKDKIHVTTAGGEILVELVLPHLDAALQRLADLPSSSPDSAAAEAEQNQQTEEKASESPTNGNAPTQESPSSSAQPAKAETSSSNT